jgi:hypothetical protein
LLLRGFRAGFFGSPVKDRGSFFVLEIEGKLRQGAILSVYALEKLNDPVSGQTLA